MGKTCLKCGYRDDTDLSPPACPRCGAVYAKVEADVARGQILRSAAPPSRTAPAAGAPPAPGAPASPAAAAAAKKRTKPAHLALAGLLLSFIVLGLVAESRRSDMPRAFGEVDAFALCSNLIRGLSKDPEKAEIPRVANTGAPGAFRFTWAFNTRSMRMRNGLGLEVPMTGSCTVDAAQQRVTSLTLDGKVLF